MEEPALLPEKSSQLFPIFLGLSLEQRDIYAVLELSVSNPECLIEEENDGGVVLCMLEIPDLMIPCDILLFFADSLATIDCFRIFRHYLYTEKYVGLLFFSNKASANTFMAQYNHKILSTLFEGVCELCPVTSISIQTKLHHIPLPQYHILQRNFNDMNLAILTSASECEVAQYLVELNRIDDKTRSCSDLSTDQKDSPESTLHQNDICALCLESFIVRHPQSIVLYCGHAFHSSCLVRAEGMFCPVCRFQHAQSLQQTPACHYCRQATVVSSAVVPSSDTLAQDTLGQTQDTRPFPWKSPPLPTVPVTAGSESTGSLLAASSLHASFATEIARDTWLCLVCGVTCCGELRDNHRLRHFHETRHAYAMHIFTRRVFDFVENGFVHSLVLRHTADEVEDDDTDRDKDTPATLPNRRTDEDTAVVDVEEIAHLGEDNINSNSQDTAGHREGVSGGKTPSEDGVARHPHHHPPLVHLETNMEPVSLSDVSRHMHPVSVSSRDTTNETPPETHWTRPLHPPPVLIPRDEAHIAFKLEDLLQQYNEVLAWRMQQTREHYETQLRRIWQEPEPAPGVSQITTAGDTYSTHIGKEPTIMKRSVVGKESQQQHQPHSQEGLFWLKRLHTSLQQEKHKWLAQNDTLRHKLRMSEQEMQDTLTLVHQLEANEPIWQRQVKRQETLWRQTQQAKSSDKRQWEDKVAALMRRLEETTKFDSSVRPSNRVCETAPGDDEV